VATEYQHVGNTVDVLGKSLPYFGSPDAPKPAVGYDLSAWRAHLSVGTHQTTADAVDMIQHILRGEAVRLVGPPSVGKTSAIREVAAAMGAVVHDVDCGEGKRDCELIGEPTIDDGHKIVFKDGEITSAVRRAINDPDVMHFLVLDEIDHLQPEVQSLLHSVLEGGTLSVDGEILTLPDNLRVVATANTTGHGDVTGRHAAARLSDTAFLSRWNITMTVDYILPDKEAAILNQFIGLDDAQRMVEVAGKTRVDDPTASMHVSNPIALRQLLAWARASASGTSLRDAYAWTVLASASDTDQPIYADLALRVFGWDS
jgi:cobaltochelatase CobS